MALISCNGGELKMLDLLLDNGHTSAENLTLKLYKTNVTPTATSTAGSFTEADFTGYSSVTLTSTSWGASTTVGGAASSTYGSAQVFTSSGSAQTIYGYFIVGASSNALYWAELFSSSVTLNSGDSLSITPVITLDSAN